MTDPDEALLEAKVTRYRIARIRLGQLLVPLAVILSVLARRAPTTLTVILAFALQGIALAVFLSAMKGFGWQPLRFGDGGVSFGETGLRILRREVRRWTITGRVARLYGGEVSFKLQVREGSEAVLGALLQSQFGSALAMERRGSTRARVIALCAAVAGVVLCGLCSPQRAPAPGSSRRNLHAILQPRRIQLRLQRETQPLRFRIAE